MTNRTEWTEDRKETLRRLLAEGMTYQQAAERMGLRRQQTKNAAHQFHLTLPHPPRKWREWQRDEYDMLERLLADGLTYPQISVRMERGINEVKGAAQRLGMMTKERRGQHRRRSDWPQIDRIVTDCIEARLMTIPQAHRYLTALGYRLGLSTLYNRVDSIGQKLRARAEQNGKRRKVVVGRRVMLGQIARKRQQLSKEVAA